MSPGLPAIDIEGFFDYNLTHISPEMFKQSGLAQR